jgi:hypothetical protein
MQASDSVSLERDELHGLIMEALTKHHSSFEVSDIPMYLAKYRVETLRAIADELAPYAGPEVDVLTAKLPIRLIRAILNVGKERYVLTALKSMSFFTLAAAASRPHPYDQFDDTMDPRNINRTIEKAYKDSQFGFRDNEKIQDDHSHDAEHYARAIKAQHLADLIRLEAMFPLRMDYFIQVGILARNADLIEPALDVVVHAADTAYAKSRTMPDGSGRRKLLDAQDVLAIAEACKSDEAKHRAVIALIEERGGFDRELLDMVANAASLPLAQGIL